MKLYGSTTSPFVRRTRLLLADRPHEFVALNIYEGEGRAQLKAISPVLKIPVLEDNGTYIYDSRVIFQYLQTKGWHRALSWEEQNLLTTLDGVNDALVSLFLLKRSGVELAPGSLLAQSYAERIDLSLKALEADARNGRFRAWDYPTICAYALVDWAVFRKLHDFQGSETLLQLLEVHAQQPGVAQTSPR